MKSLLTSALCLFALIGKAQVDTSAKLFHIRLHESKMIYLDTIPPMYAYDDPMTLRTYTTNPQADYDTTYYWNHFLFVADKAQSESDYWYKHQESILYVIYTSYWAGVRDGINFAVYKNYQDYRNFRYDFKSHYKSSKPKLK